MKAQTKTKCGFLFFDGINGWHTRFSFDGCRRRMAWFEKKKTDFHLALPSESGFAVRIWPPKKHLFVKEPWPGATLRCLKATHLTRKIKTPLQASLGGEQTVF